jgi:DNA polymerase-3 subunit delta'
VILGQDRAIAAFRSAWDRGALHHAWLLAGPRGVGKAGFASAAATYVLAQAAGPAFAADGVETPADHPIAKLMAASSHPDFRLLERLENAKTGKLSRNIAVDQVRSLGELFDLTPSMSDWRAVVIDAADDLEASAANALLKMLEEPPPNCLFLLVSHAAGRLLPTIRSRCRRVDFQPLADDVMTDVLARQQPSLSQAERDRIVAVAGGSAGRALAYAEQEIGKLAAAAQAILADGDPTNARRSQLASELSGKNAAERYAAFLELVPTLIAQSAREARGEPLARTLDAYAEARELSRLAPRLSLDPAATVFEMGTILASASRSLP